MHWKGDKTKENPTEKMKNIVNLTNWLCLSRASTNQNAFVFSEMWYRLLKSCKVKQHYIRWVEAGNPKTSLAKYSVKLNDIAEPPSPHVIGILFYLINVWRSVWQRRLSSKSTPAFFLNSSFFSWNRNTREWWCHVTSHTMEDTC